MYSILVSCLLIAHVHSGSSSSVFSVTCTTPGDGSTCSMAPGSSTDADVTGRFHDEMYETGWGRLYLQSSSVNANTAFSAGFLEGALTAHRITTHLANYK